MNLNAHSASPLGQCGGRKVTRTRVALSAGPNRVMVCANTYCLKKGAMKTFKMLEEMLPEGVRPAMLNPKGGTSHEPSCVNRRDPPNPVHPRSRWSSTIAWTSVPWGPIAGWIRVSDCRSVPECLTGANGQRRFSGKLSQLTSPPCSFPAYSTRQ